MQRPQSIAHTSDSQGLQSMLCRKEAHASVEKMLGNPHDAEDVVQTLMFRIVADARFRRHVAGARDPAAYLMRALHHACIDLMRIRQRHALTPQRERARRHPAPDEMDVARPLQRQELADAFDAMEARLSPRDRQILHAYRRDPDASDRKIARRVRCDHKTVARARVRIWSMARQLLCRHA